MSGYPYKYYFSYTNGRNQTITLEEIFDDTSLIHKLNAKLCTALKNDLKKMGVVSHPTRLGRVQYFYDLFEKLKELVDKETFLNEGYSEPFEFERHNGFDCNVFCISNKNKKFYRR